MAADAAKVVVADVRVAAAVSCCRMVVLALHDVEVIAGGDRSA